MAYPDTVGLVITYLNGLHAIPVASRVPSPRPAEWIQVRRVGGVQAVPVRDVPRIDIFYWAATEPAAQAGGDLVRTQIHNLAGSTLGSVQCYRVEEVLQRQTDDPLTGAPGWWATYSITLRADNATSY